MERSPKTPRPNNRWFLKSLQLSGWNGVREKLSTASRLLKSTIQDDTIRYSDELAYGYIRRMHKVKTYPN